MTTPLNPIAALDADLTAMLRLKAAAAEIEAERRASDRRGELAHYRHLLHDADPDSTVPVFPDLDKGYTPERAS